MSTTTLNEKIRNCNINWAVVENYATSDLINEIEILVLNSQVELLNSIDTMGYMIVVGEGDTVTPIKNKISELNNKIKELTK